MATPSGEERRIRYLACERFFPMSQLRDHERDCPEMPQHDDELDTPGQNLRK